MPPPLVILIVLFSLCPLTPTGDRIFGQKLLWLYIDSQNPRRKAQIIPKLTAELRILSLDIENEINNFRGLVNGLNFYIYIFIYFMFQYYSVLVSEVEHSGWKLACFTEWSP